MEKAATLPQYQITRGKAKNDIIVIVYYFIQLDIVVFSANRHAVTVLFLLHASNHSRGIKDCCSFTKIHSCVYNIY
jgi:hypothetical protein